MVIFIEPAGCGRSLLTKTFGEWLASTLEVDVGYVNLDPGFSYIPHAPHFNIRKYFTIQEIMKRENLGPNGAMIRASELMDEFSSVIVSEIKRLDPDFIFNRHSRASGDIRL